MTEDARVMKKASLAVVALALTACGGGAQATPATGNVRVCGHYRTQRAHVKNLAMPTLADAVQFETWVALDAQQAARGSAVARDLAALSRAQHDTSGPQAAVYGASTRVLKDCTALGIKFQQ